MSITKIDQRAPEDRDDGRDVCADVIKEALAKGGKDEIVRHFSNAAVNAMLKTTSDRNEENSQVAHGERFIGNHLTLDDPNGDLLRKGTAPQRTAVQAIRDAHTAGRLNRLIEALQATVSSRLTKDAASDVVSQGSRRARVTDPTFPPQSRNNQWDTTRAPDGATLAHDAVEADRAAAGIRQNASPFLGPHSVPHATSLRELQALRTQDDGNPRDPTTEAIKRDLRAPKPFGPGAFSGEAQDTRRDDSFR